MDDLPKPITRKALLALPRRAWDRVTDYDAILVVPTGKKHDSGYSLMAIVGVRGKKAQSMLSVYDPTDVLISG